MHTIMIHVPGLVQKQAKQKEEGGSHANFIGDVPLRFSKPQSGEADGNGILYVINWDKIYPKLGCMGTSAVYYTNCCTSNGNKIIGQWI